MLHSRTAALLLIPTLTGLATVPAGSGPSSPVRPTLQALDQGSVRLALHGLPLEGQPLRLEVRGAPSTAFQVHVEVDASGISSPRPGALPGLIPGARAATEAELLGDASLGTGFLLQGVTGPDGFWSRTFRAPAAGSELRLLTTGAPPDASSRAPLRALELTIQAPFRAEPGDLVVSEIQRTPGAQDVSQDAWFEVHNQTPYEIDLFDWTLRDERGRAYELSVAPGEVVLPSRAFSVLAVQGLRLAPEADAVVLEDDQGRTIDRVSYDSAAGWPASERGLSLQLASRHLDAAANDRPSSWFQASTAGASIGQVAPGTSPGRATPCLANGGVQTDVPDLNYLDVNCDGIDGDIARAVFVATSGSPTNPGTMSQPLDSIQAGIALAAVDPARDHVYVSEGVYLGMITLVDGVSVWGGYSATNGWERSPAHLTRLLNGKFLGNGIVGVIGTGLSGPVTLGSLYVETSDGVSFAGYHSYGIVLQQSDEVTLQGVTVVAGDASTGNPGTAGTPGGAGKQGGAAGCSNGYNFCGGAGGVGSYYGGNGGNGGDTPVHWNGHPGLKGSGPNGGNGGLGGAWIGAGANGSAGGAGSAGSAGAAGSNDGSTAGGLWITYGNGNPGSNGASGSGGGGGGGGSQDFWGFSGNGGGGGGGGGSPGLSGTGGQAGGSSFALFLAASSVTLDTCNQTAGAGRPGGTGGAGGAGGAGGSSGQGGNCCSVPYGGFGGAGGAGGKGGSGAGGGGGHSYGILIDAASTAAMVATSVSSAAPGAGGASPGGNPGKNGEAQAVKQL